MPILTETTLNPDLRIIEDKNLRVPNDLNPNECFGDLSLYHYYKENLLYARISNGSEIRFKCFNKLSPQVISNILMNVPFGYYLYQNLKLALHGSAVRIENNTVAFLGESGSGKSTLAASLSQYGNIITEDLCYFGLNNQDQLQLYTMPHFLKLEQDVINMLGLKCDELEEVPFDKRNRFYYYFKNDNCPPKNNINTIYLLKWGKKFRIYKPEIAELFSFLSLCSFSCYPIDKCNFSNKKLFEHINLLSKKINFYVLERNKDSFFDDNERLISHIRT